MKKLLVLAAVLAITASSALALTGSKDGSLVSLNPGDANAPSGVRADFEFNTGGSIDFVPTTGGSFDGWGEYFITTIENNAGADLELAELGFPCCGPETAAYGWLVWVGDMGGMVPPMGDALTADFYGAFAPVDPAPDTFPPTVYTYLPMSGITIAAGHFFTVGYDVTGNGGQTDANGYETWAWYGGAWDADSGWGRTAIIQVKGNTGGTATDSGTWGGIKAMFN